MSGVANFQGQCGECKDGYYSATTIGGGMQPDQSATVNGNSPDNCVVANDGAKVFQIQMVKIAGIYDYQVRVQAQGPKGAFSGSMYLAFKDATGDVYYLSIYSSTLQWHTVSYNSKSPNIVAIYWSNYSFKVQRAENAEHETKAEYQVVSPALEIA